MSARSSAAKSGKPTSTAASPKPALIRIQSDGKHGEQTRVSVVDPDDPTSARELDCVHKIELVLEAGNINQAILHTFNVEASVLAEVVELKDKLLPPRTPGPEMHIHIDIPKRRWWGGLRSHCTIEKVTMLPGFGVESVVLSEGWTTIPGPVDWVVPA